MAEGVPRAGPSRTGLRTGWTTGSCAAAAAKAAVTGLLTGARPPTVEIALPTGRRVPFDVERTPEDPATAVVIKDAGDDPDCTDGARMTAVAERGSESAALELRAGNGVGTVTRPGLGLDVGAPSITAVPRSMIHDAVAEALAEHGATAEHGDGPPSGLTVTFSVPGGEQMAAKTTNTRLGIVGGISILGTTGIVRPFSTAAYRASVVQQIDVAAAQSQSLIVLATGSRSDAAAQRLRTDLPTVCFVEVGDFTGVALRRAANVGMDAVLWVGMAGKITKLAAGVLMTHFHRSNVDSEVLEAVASAAGAPEAVVRAATETATARHFYEACIAHGAIEPLSALCRMAAESCRQHVAGRLDIQVVMVDFEGLGVVASSS